MKKHGTERILFDRAVPVSRTGDRVLHFEVETVFGQGRSFFFLGKQKKNFQTSTRAREPDPSTSLKVRKRLLRGRGRKKMG